MNVTLTNDKDTKNTKRYVGNADGADFSVYVQKSSPLASRETITITVSEDE